MSSGHQGDNQWEYTECLLGHVVTGVLRLPLLHVATPPFFVLYELGVARLFPSRLFA